MARIKSLERYFYAVDYEKQIKTNLTKKQFLVYTYLLSISKWDAQSKEEHYYVYKNSFVAKEAQKKIGITAPTWRNAFKKLEEEGLITVREKWYEIKFPRTFAPLDIRLISFLLEFSCILSNGGNLVGVYATLYKYWSFCQDNQVVCKITINQLLKLFEQNYRKENGKYYEVVLGIFETQGLITIKRNERKYLGEKYTEYEILFVNTTLPQALNDRGYGPDDIKDIVEALENSFE